MKEWEVSTGKLKCLKVCFASAKKGWITWNFWEKTQLDSSAGFSFVQCEYFSDYGELSYPFILTGFFLELIFKQLDETICLLIIYEKLKAIKQMLYIEAYNQI